MVDYNVLLMIIGNLFTACKGVWVDPMLPWPAIYIADFIQGDIPLAYFLTLMGDAGPEYVNMAQCIILVQ